MEILDVVRYINQYALQHLNVRLAAEVKENQILSWLLLTGVKSGSGWGNRPYEYIPGGPKRYRLWTRA